MPGPLLLKHWKLSRIFFSGELRGAQISEIGGWDLRSLNKCPHHNKHQGFGKICSRVLPIGGVLPSEISL
jgi:hypothetical protein